MVITLKSACNSENRSREFIQPVIKFAGDIPLMGLKEAPYLKSKRKN